MLVGGADNVVVYQRAIARVFFGSGVVHGARFHPFHRFNTGRTGIDAYGAIR